MPRELSVPEQQRFLAGRRIAVLTTVGRGGQPVSTPIWYLYRDGRFYFRTAADAAKTRNVRRDPRVCICVQEERPPYTAVVVHGTAEVSDKEGRLAELIPRRYLGLVGGLAYRRMARQLVEQGEEVTIVVTPQRVVTIAYGPETPLVARFWLLLKRVLPPWL